jgi:hypothetical protein
MACNSCGSINQEKYLAEVGMHFQAEKRRQEPRLGVS